MTKPTNKMLSISRSFEITHSNDINLSFQQHNMSLPQDNKSFPEDIISFLPYIILSPQDIILFPQDIIIMSREQDNKWRERLFLYNPCISLLIYHMVWIANTETGLVPKSGCGVLLFSEGLVLITPVLVRQFKNWAFSWQNFTKRTIAPWDLRLFKCAWAATRYGKRYGSLLEASSSSVCYMSEQRKLWRDCKDVQARLSLCWSPMW